MGLWTIFEDFIFFIRVFKSSLIDVAIGQAKSAVPTKNVKSFELLDAMMIATELFSFGHGAKPKLLACAR